MSYFFYAMRPDMTSPLGSISLNNRYSFRIWRPDVGDLAPHGIPKIPFTFWWFCHYLRLFSNRDYAMIIVYDGGRVIHRSVVFPKYFRSPFMATDDLQIGDTWTQPEHRGQGLASFAIQKITEIFRKPGRTFWYVVEKENRASIRAIEKAGFEMVGEGVRTKRFGIRVLGAYVIQQTSTLHN